MLKINNIEEFYGKKLLLALSGGLDSVVLFHLLLKQQLNFSVAHCNFQLRGASSDADATFCKELAKKYNIPFHYEIMPIITEKKNIQLEARTLRYEWFHSLIVDYQYDYLLTAHHADDSFETFMINLARGSGLKGLSGIKNHSSIKRPLLPYFKADIKNYAIKNQLVWREDASNAKDDYVRNYIRHHLSPLMPHIHPEFWKNFQKSIHFIHENQNLLTEYLTIIKKTIELEPNRFSIQKLLEYQSIETILNFIFKPYGFHNTTEITKLLYAPTGKYLNNKRYKLLKDQNSLYLLNLNKNYNHQKINKLPIKLTQKTINLTPILPHVDFKNTIFVNKILTIYVNNIAEPFYLRRWTNEDFFQPLGMKGRKKISKLLKDRKIPIFLRSEIWLLCNATDEILWVVGIQASELINNQEFKKHKIEFFL